MMTNLIKKGYNSSISFTKNYGNNDGWTKSSTKESSIDVQIDSSLTTITLGKVYHLLSMNDRKMILNCLYYFSCIDQYEKIGRSFEHNKLPFVNLAHALMCLMQAKETIDKHQHITVNPDNNEELTLRVVTGFYSDGDTTKAPIGVSPTNKDSKDIVVTDTWEEFKAGITDVDRITGILKKALIG